jgi:hypothetical protein
VINYQQDVLTNIVEPQNQTIFENRPWIFQQDSAPVHKAKTMQQQLEKHVPEIISSEHWPSTSPDLIPFDYNLCSVLGSMVYTRSHHNLKSLRQALVEATDNFPMDVVHTAINT